MQGLGFLVEGREPSTVARPVHFLRIDGLLVTAMCSEMVQTSKVNDTWCLVQQNQSYV